MFCRLSSPSISSFTFYKLNATCHDSSNGTSATWKVYNFTAGFNFTLFFICAVSGILTYFKFNSITVLNMRVCPTAISNIFWILYFSILGLRSLIIGIVYVDNAYILRNKKGGIIPDILFPTGNYLEGDHMSYCKVHPSSENFFKILEVMFLCWSLEYQRKHRSKGFIQDELQSFNDTSNESTRACKLFRKILKTTYNIFTAQALLCLVFLVILTIFLLKSFKSKTTEYLYWTYHGCLWSLCISAIVLMAIIVAQRTIGEGPSRLTKVFILWGVVFTLPSDIPLFIWQQCICQDCSLQVFVGYVVAQVLLIIAIVLFLAVLIREFERLKEEAHWNVIDQAESYYSITESM